MRCVRAKQTGECGLCQANIRSRGNYKGHSAYKQRKPTVRWPRVLDMKKPTNVGPGATGAKPAGEVWVAETFPGIWEALTEDKWDDGTKRERSTLLLLVEGDRWKGMFNDKALQRCAWATGDTLEDLLATIEAGIAGDLLDWRVSKPWGKK